MKRFFAWLGELWNGGPAPLHHGLTHADRERLLLEAARKSRLYEERLAEDRKPKPMPSPPPPARPIYTPPLEREVYPAVADDDTSAEDTLAAIAVVAELASAISDSLGDSSSDPPDTTGGGGDFGGGGATGDW